MEQKTLTRAEEQIMQYLWGLEKAYLKDLVEQFPEPRPAYTTISTVVRVLVKKGFIGFKTYGKINEYFPLISKHKYFQRSVKPIIANYIAGAPSALASFFANDKLNLSELEELKKLVDDRIRKLKSKNK
ncbi:MAG TPA: BlaI/MecI/CopY family transcriptional regulator [Chryseosolibacter sp.]